MRHIYTLAAVVTQLIGIGFAQTACTISLSPSSKPVAADGYNVKVIAQGLRRPRSLQFDSEGNLLMVQSSAGIFNFRLDDSGGTCVDLEDPVDLIQDRVKTSLNHGLALSADGKKLYASDSGRVYSWDYDAKQRKIMSNQQVVVTGLANAGHSTRTLHYSSASGQYLVVVRGSAGNIDLECGEMSTGHCQMKAFDMQKIPAGGYDFSRDGIRLGWGMRNSVGIAEHPTTHGIWTVENTIDDLMRLGSDIHFDNPGEELNFHGAINSTTGLNYGYPYCSAAWDPSTIPNNTGIQVGSEFAVDVGPTSKTDSFCARVEPPRLTFEAHTAPLDIKFNGSNEAFVSFHGSWNRDDPIGYRIARIQFQNGQPVPSRRDRISTSDVVTNADVFLCPDNCFRPVGIAFDKLGRLFFVSDTTGELYVVVKKATTTQQPSSSNSPSSRPTASPSEANILHTGILNLMSIALVVWHVLGG